MEDLFYGRFHRFQGRPSGSTLTYMPGDNLIVEVVDNCEKPAPADALYKELFTVRTPQQVGMILHYPAFMLLLFHLTSVSVWAQKDIYTHQSVSTAVGYLDMFLLCQFIQDFDVTFDVEQALRIDLSDRSKKGLITDRRFPTACFALLLLMLLIPVGA